MNEASVAAYPATCSRLVRYLAHAWLGWQVWGHLLPVADYATAVADGSSAAPGSQQLDRESARS